MAAFIIPALPVIGEGLAAAGAWVYRAYRAYRVYQAATTLEAIATAQQQAAQNEKENEDAKTASQAKADETVSSECKNCNEDPDCETARDKVKEALYGTKGQDAQNRGLAERLCHWLRGPDEALRTSHLKAVQEAASRVEKASNWLSGDGKRPYGAKEGARLTKAEKNKMLKNCNYPQDLKEDVKDMLDCAERIESGKSPIKPSPSANFASECTAAALSIVKKSLGK